MTRNPNLEECDQLEEMLDCAEEFYLAKGYLPGEAYDLAVKAVYEETGYQPQDPTARIDREAAYRAGAQHHAEETAFGPSRRRTEEPARGPSRRSTEQPSRNTHSGHGTEYDRMFQNGADRDAARTSGRILSVEEIMQRQYKIITDWLKKGADEDFARQQGEKFMIREMGKRSKAGMDTTGCPPGCDCGDESDDYSDPGARRAAGGRAKSARSEYDDYDAGRAQSFRSEYSGPEERYDTSHAYTKEQLRAIMEEIYEDWMQKDTHPDEARQEAKKWFNRNKDRGSGSSRRSGFDSFSDMRDALDDNEGYGSHPGSSRGPRTGMPRPPVWDNPMFDKYFTDKPEDDFRTRREPPRYSSRSGPRGYRTEERRPGRFSSGNYNGYDDRSGWHGGRNDQPPMDRSGVKPTEDLYVVLGVSKSATTEEIKQAHRKLCVKHHPDRVKGGPAAKKAATEKTAQINQACDVLKDEDTRAFYDRTGLIASIGESPDAP